MVLLAIMYMAALRTAAFGQNISFRVKGPLHKVKGKSRQKLNRFVKDWRVAQLRPINEYKSLIDLCKEQQ